MIFVNDNFDALRYKYELIRICNQKIEVVITPNMCLVVFSHV